jgi:hypothetical protein
MRRYTGLNVLARCRQATESCPSVGSHRGTEATWSGCPANSPRPGSAPRRPRSCPRYRAHAEYGNRSAATRVAAELAPLAGLQREPGAPTSPGMSGGSSAAARSRRAPETAPSAASYDQHAILGSARRVTGEELREGRSMRGPACT